MLSMIAGVAGRIFGAANAARALTKPGGLGRAYKRAKVGAARAFNAAAGGKPSAAATRMAERGGEREGFLDRIWKIDSAVALFERIVGKLSSLTSTFVHTIQVSAVGGPHSDLRRVWYLTCAAAFGRFRNRIGATGYLEYQLEAAWDITGKATMVTLGYTVSGILPQADQAIRGALDAPTSSLRFGLSTAFPQIAAAWVALEGASRSATPTTGPATRIVAGGIDGARELLFRGPDQVTVGGNWPAFVTGSSAVARDGEYREVPVASIVELGEFLIDRLAGPGGPARPNLFRELPFVSVRNSEDVVTAVPVGQIADLARDPNFLTRYTGSTGPVAFYGGTFGGFPRVPRMPDSGRVITSGEKFHPDVQPPKPPTDGHSRCSALQLVTLALHAPCHAPESVVPTNVTANTKGFFVQGADDTDTPLAQVPIPPAATAAATALFPTLGLSTSPRVDNSVPRVTEE